MTIEKEDYERDITMYEKIDLVLKLEDEAAVLLFVFKKIQNMQQKKKNKKDKTKKYEY